MEEDEEDFDGLWNGNAGLVFGTDDQRTTEPESESEGEPDDGAERDLHHVPPVDELVEISEEGLGEFFIPGVSGLDELPEGETDACDVACEADVASESVFFDEGDIGHEPEPGEEEAAPDFRTGLPDGFGSDFPGPVVGEVEEGKATVLGVKGEIEEGVSGKDQGDHQNAEEEHFEDGVAFGTESDSEQEAAETGPVGTEDERAEKSPGEEAVVADEFLVLHES